MRHSPRCCEGCGVDFLPPYPVTAAYWSTRRFCSRTCMGEVTRGQPKPPEVVKARAKVWRRTITAKVLTCVRCGNDFNANAPTQKYCSGQCWNAVNRPKRVAAQKHRLRITPKQFQELIALYGDRCEICGAEGHDPPQPGKGRLCVDHDHGTGEIRGLLCHRCNTALGLLRDNPKLLAAASDYLTKPKL